MVVFHQDINYVLFLNTNSKRLQTIIIICQYEILGKPYLLCFVHRNVKDNLLLLIKK